MTLRLPAFSYVLMIGCGFIGGVVWLHHVSQRSWERQQLIQNGLVQRVIDLENKVQCLTVEDPDYPEIYSPSLKVNKIEIPYSRQRARRPPAEIWFHQEYLVLRLEKGNGWIFKLQELKKIIQQDLMSKDELDKALEDRETAEVDLDRERKQQQEE